MERQTYTNTNRYLFLFLIALMVSCSKSDVQIAKSLNKEIAIYPDYKDVTIPVNIAPLNFSIADSSEHCLIIKGEKTQLQVYSDEGWSSGDPGVRCWCHAAGRRPGIFLSGAGS